MLEKLLENKALQANEAARHTLEQGFPNFSARAQNDSARDCGPPSTLEVAYDVALSCAHALLGQCKHMHPYNTEEQQPNSHNIIFK